MIKKLLKKLFGAKEPEIAARKSPALPGAAKPAAAQQEHRRRGGKEGERVGEHKRRERPVAVGGEAAATGGWVRGGTLL